MNKNHPVEEDIDLASLFENWLAETEAEIESKQKQNLRVQTGIKIVDTILAGGFRPEQLVILGGTPAVGKTTFILQIAMYNAIQGNRVGIWEVEMSAVELLKRVLANYTHVRLHELTDPTAETLAYIKSKVQENYTEFATMLSNIRIHVSSRDTKPQILEKCDQYGYSLLIFDYLQRFGSMDPRRPYLPDLRQKIETNVSILKEIAVMYKAVVLAVSALNRESMKNGISITAFRESSDIEYAADVIMTLSTAIQRKNGEWEEATNTEISDVRAENANQVVLLKIMKCKHYKEGKCLLNFWRNYQKFGAHVTRDPMELLVPTPDD
ncbi:MAG: DnaB-like helicase C-terminal domain-containing protein, partial [Methanothermobacter tenebrarum]